MKTFQQIVDAQHRYFQSGATRPLKSRLAALRGLRSAIVQNETRILQALQQDLGKNAFEAYVSEIGIVLGEIRVAIKLAKKLARPVRAPSPLFLWPSKSTVHYEPLGVCLIISPWNYPFQLALAPLVAAIATGNCAIVKPSERAVQTSLVIQRILSETFSSAFVHTVIADRQESAELLKQPFDKLFFTGSKQVGQIIYRAAAEKMVPVTLELGGKNPCIVMEDANIATAARRIVWGKFFNAGQTCVAPDYILVHHSVAPQLIEALREEIGRQFGESPADTPHYGCLIDRSHLDRLCGLLNDTSPVCGGVWDAKKRYFSPTIVTGIDWTHPLMADEIFGPILPVIPFESLSDAMARIGQLPKSLALYLFSNSRATHREVFTTLSFGGGCINDALVHFSSPHLSVGGTGPSGIGRYRGMDGYRAFSNQKSIVNTPIHPEIKLRYPPFSKLKLWLVKKLMK